MTPTEQRSDGCDRQGRPAAPLARALGQAILERGADRLGARRGGEPRVLRWARAQ